MDYSCCSKDRKPVGVQTNAALVKLPPSSSEGSSSDLVSTPSENSSPISIPLPIITRSRMLCQGVLFQRHECALCVWVWWSLLDGKIVGMSMVRLGLTGELSNDLFLSLRLQTLPPCAGVGRWGLGVLWLAGHSVAESIWPGQPQPPDPTGLLCLVLLWTGSWRDPVSN